MKIGFVGLGKLGFPVAFSMASKGHEVLGYDESLLVRRMVESRSFPHQENDLAPLLDSCNVQLATIDEIVEQSDLIFMAIQTPHIPKFEGATRLPEERADFDYSYLKSGVQQVAESALRLQMPTTLIVISTVLPGTIEREVQPLLNEYTRLCYNPFFIAMGTVIQDFEHPEFVLLGCDHPDTVRSVSNFYETIHSQPIFVTSIKNAELIKVTYNTYISSKIAFINTVMELCHKVGADVDAVTDALSLATDRIISPKYMRGGMGDGGGCHPRDNIALSWLAKRLDLSYDYFEHIMVARERQTEWLATLIEDQVKATGLPVILMGVAFKANSNLCTGSPALLLSNILKEKNIEHSLFDPHIVAYPFTCALCDPRIYFISTQHEVFRTFQFGAGSIVLDPFGFIEPQQDVTLIRIGRSWNE